MHIWRAAIFAALFILGIVSSAFAQDITLRSRDGAIELTGTFLGFDGEFYRIDTKFGELTVDSSGVLCDGPSCPSLTDYVAELSVSGSATVGSVLMPALLESFALRNGLNAKRQTIGENRFAYILSDTRSGKMVGIFTFRVTNTDEGFADLLAGEADIVMSLREIRPSEIALAREAGLGNLETPNRARVLALDALVPVVAANNPVNKISLTDLARVLSGKLSNWRELGGPDAPVTVHVRDANSGLSQELEDKILHPAQTTLTASAERYNTNAKLADAVARDPFGIGIASFSDIGNAKPLLIGGNCGFSLRAARRSIKTEDFPLTAPMFLYVPARRLPALAREFLTFTRTPPAQIVIRRAGFVDQAPEEIPVDLQGNRFTNAVLVTDGDNSLKELKRLTRTLSEMRRLTTSFRFETGSTRLDAQSRSNVQQLARSLEAGIYDGRKLVFVGFSDGVGPAQGNLTIARKRAETVRRAVEQTAETADLDQIEVLTDAFGEAMPMACDETSWGRQVNRRVEVWVR
ncbi:phosphate ABC transporter substrate-binding/OmpA family protein [uncultured Pelagimonas sp.]|uniref:phosphate ABC transporter substrate-binding/OmpA family protein n=1 Tax=uncultured Pelagimonas sp. TaxID=1618102 RepID=UPI00262478F1|nr:phosphate ABC transporter substrate-binding/OmpA family protein [uncultured Pelagimonas sp.]